MSERDGLCNRCRGGVGEVRYSWGIYAMFACDHCWKTSGYAGSTPENDRKFDPMDAGEVLESEDY